jgi:hypothetical protein
LDVKRSVLLGWWKEKVLISREPTNQDTEFLLAVKRSVLIGWWKEKVLIGREPTNQNQPGHGVIGCQTERFDWSGERSVPIGRANGAFRLVGNRPIRVTEFFGWSGTDWNGVLIGCQTERFDWSGEWTVAKRCLD